VFIMVRCLVVSIHLAKKVTARKNRTFTVSWRLPSASAIFWTVALQSAQRSAIAASEKPHERHAHVLRTEAALGGLLDPGHSDTRYVRKVKSQAARLQIIKSGIGRNAPLTHARNCVRVHSSVSAIGYAKNVRA